uniref:Uncharacterized protein n=1 Tax=Knipowitschia caucasica TaxID=637954 RepID=A0AAV2KD96_KNICA
MEEEMQQLREQLAQLEADNERLRQERAAPQAGPAGAFHAPNVSSDQARSLGSRTPSTERVFVMARDRKCPLFNDAKIWFLKHPTCHPVMVLPADPRLFQ